MKESSIYGMTYYPAEGQMMFNVKADESGMAFVKQLRKALNRDRYTIRVRGSLSNRSGLRASGKYYDQSTPLAVSDRWRVYIDERHPRPTYQSDTDGVLQSRIINLKTELANLSVAEQQAKHTVAELTKIADSRLAIMEQNRATAEKQRQKILELEDCISNWQTYYDEREQDVKNYEERLTKLSEIINERNNEIRKLTERVDKVTYVGLSQQEISTIKHWEGHKFIDIARYVYRQTGAKLMSLKVFKEASELGLKDSKLVCDYLVFPFENPQRNG